jgi:outer membrane protein assembly factor BamA
MFLGLAGLCLCDANANAQSSHYSCCAPEASCDPGIKPISRRNPHSPQIYIDSLTFDGPIHLSAAGLKQLLGTVKDNKFNSDFTSPEEIEEWLRNPWGDEGYFEAKVKVEAKPVGSGDDGRRAITAHVDEGLQYRLGRVEFRADSNPDSDDYGTPGEPLPRRKPSSEDTPYSIELAARPVFPLEELRNLIPLQEGDIFSAEKVREGLDALKRLYGAHGYIDFVALPNTEIDVGHQTVSLLFDLVEEKQYRIGKIEVYGLDAKSENALIWKIKTGDVFNNELLQGLFDDNQYNFPAGSYWAEDPKIVRHPKTGTVDIEIKFSPCRTR